MRTLSSSVREKDAAAPRSHSESGPLRGPRADRPADPRAQRQRTGQASAIGSPGGASGFAGAKPDPSVHAEMVRQELQAAVQVCPRLAPLVPDHVLADPASATPADAARIAAAAAVLLPEPERNNGLSVQLGLAPGTGSAWSPCWPSRWRTPRSAAPAATSAGWPPASPDGAPDLRLNLARILREKGDDSAGRGGPGAERRPWRRGSTSPHAEDAAEPPDVRARRRRSAAGRRSTPSSGG